MKEQINNIANKCVELRQCTYYDEKEQIKTEINDLKNGICNIILTMPINKLIELDFEITSEMNKIESDYQGLNEYENIINNNIKEKSSDQMDKFVKNHHEKQNLRIKYSTYDHISNFIKETAENKINELNHAEKEDLKEDICIKIEELRYELMVIDDEELPPINKEKSSKIQTEKQIYEEYNNKIKIHQK